MRQYRLSRMIVTAGALGLASVLLSGCAGSTGSALADAVSPDVSLLKRCATKDLDEATRVRVDTQIAEHLNLTPTSRGTTIIKVPTHIQIMLKTAAGKEGDIPDAAITKQMKVLNDAYAPYGMVFELRTVSRVVSEKWYNGLDDAGMKANRRKGDRRHLNIYFNKQSGGLLGYATFPSDVKFNEPQDGVVCLNTTYPGGPAAPFDLGGTVVHEVGHWTGLYHTFQGGCATDPINGGDLVSDTPAQGFPTSGCPTAQDSCPALTGKDDVSNFMDYSDDKCYTHFTSKQGERARAAWYAFREFVTNEIRTPLSITPQGGTHTGVVGNLSTVDGVSYKIVTQSHPTLNQYGGLRLVMNTLTAPGLIKSQYLSFTANAPINTTFTFWAKNFTTGKMDLVRTVAAAGTMKTTLVTLPTDEKYQGPDRRPVIDVRSHNPVTKSAAPYTVLIDQIAFGQYFYP